MIGRIGLGIGKETERTSLFAKIGLVHEFGGKVRRGNRRKRACEEEHVPVRNLHEGLRSRCFEQVENRRGDPLQFLRMMTASKRRMEQVLS